MLARKAFAHTVIIIINYCVCIHRWIWNEIEYAPQTCLKCKQTNSTNSNHVEEVKTNLTSLKLIVSPFVFPHCPSLLLNAERSRNLLVKTRELVFPFHVCAASSKFTHDCSGRHLLEHTWHACRRDLVSWQSVSIHKLFTRERPDSLYLMTHKVVSCLNNKWRRRAGRL